MPDQLEFAGGTAVITGAGSGIGAGLACEAARLGMSVVVADISRERADEIVAAIIGRGGQAEAAVVDVRDDHAMGVLATDVRARLGPVRLLVNNAGIETVGFSWELTAEQWRLSTDINLIGVVNGLRAFIPAMIKDTGEGRRSAIANLSSIGAFMGVPMNAAYLASKHAVLALTECLFLEMELLGCPIDVSVIVPSLVRSRIFEDAPVADAAEVLDPHRAGSGDGRGRSARRILRGPLLAPGRPRHPQPSGRIAPRRPRAGSEVTRRALVALSYP
jgi:NAD(P)-dependent dehydrogenase (short-subunit alcohol dehydrogenase family)